MNAGGSDPNASRTDRRSWFKGTAALLMLATVTSLLPMLVGALLSDVLDPAEFGRLFGNLGLVFIAVFVGGFGLDKMVIKTISEARHTGHLEEARGFRRTGPKVTIVSCVVTAILFTLALSFSPTASRTDVIDLAAAMLVLPVQTLLRFLLGTTSPHGGAFAGVVIRDVVPGIVVSAITAVFLVFGYHDLGVFHAVAAYLIGYVVANVSMVVLRSRVEPQEFRTGPASIAMRPQIAAGIEYSVNVLIFTVLASSGMLYAQWVANDDVTTALITASLQIGSFALPIGTAAKGIMMPKIGDAVARKDRRAIRDIRRRYLATVLPPVVTIAALVLVFEERILLYYSKDYLTADTPMKVALIGSVISSLLYIDTTIAQFTRNLRRSTVRSYALVAVGWIGLWFTGQTSATSIIMVQMTLTLGCEVITILQGRKAVRAWNREEASPSTS